MQTHIPIDAIVSCLLEQHVAYVAIKADGDESPFQPGVFLNLLDTEAEGVQPGEPRVLDVTLSAGGSPVRVVEGEPSAIGARAGLVDELVTAVWAALPPR